VVYYGRDSYLYVLDMAEFKYVYLDGRDVTYEPDLTPKGLDGMKAGYIAECSIEVGLTKTHGLIKNIAKPIKDA
jgi:hypothetical protein